MRTTAWAAAVLLGSTMLWAQTSPHEHTGAEKAVPKAAAGETKPMADCQKMMERHKQMMGEMKQTDAKQSVLAQKMNAAKDDGDARLDAAVAVINEFVQQRQGMHEKMSSDAAMKSGHAMPHMSSAAGARCPMMKMGTTEGPSAHQH